MVEIIKIKEDYPEVLEYEATKFRDDLVEMEETVSDEIVLDLDGVEMLCSIAVSAIIQTYNNRLKSGKVMSVINAGEKNKKLFEMLNVNDIVDC